MAAATITDANVNSGTAIILDANRVTEKMEVFSRADETAQADLTAAFATRLNSGRYSGFGNPTITIKGVLKLVSPTTNHISKTHFENLCASAAVKTFVSDLTGTIKVLITGVNYDLDDNTTHLVDYTLDLIRVKDE